MLGWLLSCQDRRIAAAGGPGKLPQNYYLPTATDLYVAQFRTVNRQPGKPTDVSIHLSIHLSIPKWVKKWGSDGPWGFEALKGFTKSVESHTWRKYVYRPSASGVLWCGVCAG